jgi:hypothetical protein
MKAITRSALLAIAVMLAPIARAGMLTDLWYDPQESGWGLSMVQHDETAFITIYNFAADGSSRWYAAPDAHLVTVTADGGLPSFSGALYRYSGPLVGTTFDPSQVHAMPTGLVRIDPVSTDKIRVKYEAEGVQVARDMVRLTLAAPSIPPFFQLHFSLRQSTPDGHIVGTLFLTADALLRVEGVTASLVADDQLGRRCNYQGPYVQAGKLGRFAGSFSCTAGRDGIAATSGTFAIDAVEITENGITGRLRTTSPTELQDGRFGGVRP